VAALTIPLDCLVLQEHVRKCLASWPDEFAVPFRCAALTTLLSPEAPLTDRDEIGLKQLRVHLVKAKPTMRRLRIDEPDDRLLVVHCSNELAHTILRLEVALRAVNQDRRRAIDVTLQVANLLEVIDLSQRTRPRMRTCSAGT
jgi:hypothetical protein